MLYYDFKFVRIDLLLMGLWCKCEYCVIKELDNDGIWFFLYSIIY